MRLPQVAHWAVHDLRATPDSLRNIITAVRSGTWGSVSAQDLARVAGKLLVIAFWVLP